jgi:hypothetical protein
VEFDLTKIPAPRPWLALLILAMAIFAFFFPILSTFFLADDYNYVGYLLSHARAYVQGEQLTDWFVAFSAQGLQNPVLSVFFRPVVQWLWLTDFIMWGTNAFGYHLTNILLHVLNSFLVFLLARWILRQRWGAFVAGLLFALHPIHADSVSWIADRTDVLSTFFYLLGATSFVLYRVKTRRIFRDVSLAAFALAIGTKENTVALPLVLVAYDLLFAFRGWDRKIALAQIPFALILGLYVAARFLFLGQFGRNTGGGFLTFGAELFATFYVQSLGQPFVYDIDRPQLILALGVVALVIFLYRDRRALWFGLAWIVFSLLPSAAAAYVAPRLAYAPSAGLALALGAICAQPLPRRGGTEPTVLARWNLYAGILLTFFFVARYGLGLAARVDDWNAAGTVARIIPEETKKLHRSIPRGSRLQFLGAPEILRGIYIYNDNFGSAFQVAYQDPSLRAYTADKFPVLDDPSGIFFFEYRRRVVTERADIPRVLSARQKCLGNQFPSLTWDFSGEAQGWEAQNDLVPFVFRDGALRTRATGNDPHMASPSVDLSAIAVGEVEIALSVRGDAATTEGSVFWLRQGEDFSPAREQTFAIQADGAMRTYRIALARNEKLFVGDHIAQLRLDPGAMPAEIAIRSIRVNVHCRSVSGDVCQCP